jgi:chromosome segregation ATPase
MEVALTKATEAAQASEQRVHELEATVERTDSERVEDQQRLSELHEALTKEREALKNGMQERKELQKQNRTLRHENANVKRQLGQTESERSLAQVEKAHLIEVQRALQESIAKKTEEKDELTVKCTELEDQLRDVRAAHAVASLDAETLRVETVKLARQLEDSQGRESQSREKCSELERQVESNRQLLVTERQTTEVLRRKAADLSESNQRLVEQLKVEQEQKEQAVVRSSALSAQSKSTGMTMKQLETQLEQAKGRLSERTKQLTEAQLQLDQLKEMSNHLNQENESLTNEKHRTGRKVLELERKLKEQQNEHVAMRTQLTGDIQRTIDQLGTEKQSLADAVSISEAKLQETQEQLAEQQQLISSLQDEVRKSRRQTAGIESDVYDLQRQKAECEATILGLQLQNKDQNELLTQLREERKLLKDEIETLEQQIEADKLQLETDFNAQFESLRVRYQDEQSQSFTMDQQNRDKLRILESEKHEFERELRTVKAQLTQVTLDLRATAERQVSLTTQRDELLRENQEVKTNLVGQIQSFNQLEVQVKKLQKSRAKLLRKVRMLTAQNDALGNSQTELYAAQKRLEQSEIENRQLQGRLESFSEVNSNLSLEVTQTRNARDKTAQEFNEITETVRQIYTLLRPSSSQIFETGLGISGQFLKELSTLRDLLLSSHTDIESLIQERSRLISEVAELKLKGERVAKLEEDLRRELASTIAGKATVENEVRSLSELTAQYHQERQKLNDAISTLRGALSLTKEKLKASEGDKERLKGDHLQLKILLEQIRDTHNLSIQIPE